VQRFTLARQMSRRLTLCRRVGPCPADEPVRITVLLHAKDARALRDAVHAVSDPKDAAYGRHLSPDEVRDLVAPGTQDLDAVLAFLRDTGLRVEGVSGARTAVQASGPAEAVARAFDAPIGLFAPPPAVAAGRRRAYGIERDPTIPASLAAVIRVQQPIPFDAPDDEPVSLLIFLLVPEAATQRHLEILSEIAEMLSDRELRERLKTESDAVAVHKLIADWEPLKSVA